MVLSLRDLECRDGYILKWKADQEDDGVFRRGGVGSSLSRKINKC